MASKLSVAGVFLSDSQAPRVDGDTSNFAAASFMMSFWGFAIFYEKDFTYVRAKYIIYTVQVDYGTKRTDGTWTYTWKPWDIGE